VTVLANSTYVNSGVPRSKLQFWREREEEEARRASRPQDRFDSWESSTVSAILVRED
jgi:hypothetical protein